MTEDGTSTLLGGLDMDALPVREATGLPYASTVTATDDDGRETPVAHACGHDMHVTWLATAAELFARRRDAWSGTLLAVFQPAEETGVGARSMVDDGLVDRFARPDVVLGQHVMPARAGVRAWGAPAVFWFVGGTDPATYDTAVRDGALATIPTNHSPFFAPVLDPTVRTGVEAMVTAAGAWLA